MSVAYDYFIMAQGYLFTGCQEYDILIFRIIDYLAAVISLPALKQCAETTDYTILEIFHNG